MDDDDEGEDFGTILDGAVNSMSPLYDAMSRYPASPYRRRLPSSDSLTRRPDLQPSLSGPRPRSSFSSFGSRTMGTTSGLSRQSSIRRNSRPINPPEFETYSHRRRLEAREADVERTHSHDRPTLERSLSQGSSRRQLLLTRARQSEEPNTLDDLSSSFPPPTYPVRSLDEGTAGAAPGYEPSSSRPSLYQSPLPSIHHMLSTPAEPAPGSGVPRTLRRGGMRAPESLAASIPRRSFEMQWSDTPIDSAGHDAPANVISSADNPGDGPLRHESERSALVTPPADF
jgi:hypothetical protein